MRYFCNTCVQKGCCSADFYHLVKDLPIASYDRHLALDSHAHHRLQPVDLIEVLRVIYSCASLNNICGERGLDAVVFQEFTPRPGRDQVQAELVGRFGQGAEREDWLFIHPQKSADSLLHQRLRPPHVQNAILPNNLGRAQPIGIIIVLSKDEFFTIPYSQDLWWVVRVRTIVTTCGEGEFIDRIDEISVDLNKNRSAQFNRL